MIVFIYRIELRKKLDNEAVSTFISDDTVIDTIVGIIFARFRNNILVAT